MSVFLTISRDIFKNTLLAPIREVHCNISLLALDNAKGKHCRQSNSVKGFTGAYGQYVTNMAAQSAQGEQEKPVL